MTCLLSCYQETEIKEERQFDSDKPISPQLDATPIIAEKPSIENLDKSKFLNITVDTSLLFNIWTTDPNGPHADFWIRSKDFYIVDYDGDGSMPYNLKNDSIIIHYEDYIEEGKILKVTRDSLTIHWKDSPSPSNYVKWEN